MNTPSESSFIHEIFNKIFEDTFRQSPSPLPWHIPKNFLAASIVQHSRRNSSTTQESLFKSGSAFPAHPLPDQLAEPSPEQPLRDTLLNSVITLADLLGIRFLLVSSRNGGTIQRLRQLTEQFHVVVLPVPAAACSESPEARLQQHDVPQLREARLKPLVDVVEVTGLGDAKHGTGYEEALRRISAQGLRSLVEADDDDEDLLPEDDEQVLFLYRSFPGANCVNAFRILNFGLLEELDASEGGKEEKEMYEIEIKLECCEYVQIEQSSSPQNSVETI